MGWNYDTIGLQLLAQAQERRSLKENELSWLTEFLTNIPKYYVFKEQLTGIDEDKKSLKTILYWLYNAKAIHAITTEQEEYFCSLYDLQDFFLIKTEEWFEEHSTMHWRLLGNNNCDRDCCPTRVLGEITETKQYEQRIPQA